MIGNTVVYQSISKTTQDVIKTFSGLTPQGCGLVAIAAQQISDRGEYKLNFFRTFWPLTF